MFIGILLAVLSLRFGVASCNGVNSDEKLMNVQTKYPFGDIKACLMDPLFQKTNRYEVLPGMGWDNLQNKDAGLLVTYNYSQCKTTDDGRYLIPDNIVTVPLKSSKLETFAEIFEHWSNFTSTTSNTINVGEDLDLKDFGINGKFSREYEKVKTNQVRDKSVTTRVQARYVRYTAQLQPDTTLNPVFKTRLINIATHIQLNKSAMATYESQLLVRDFGTHVVTNIDAGSVIGQLDEIKSVFALNKDISKRKILASASASFYKVANISIGNNDLSENEIEDQYLGNRTHSRILTHGGPIYKPNNFSMNQWAEEMGNDLTAVDRRGDPIYYLISPQTLPELSPSIIYDLTKRVQSAVKSYYKHNIYKGCTNPESPNFSFIANVDDDSCESPSTNYTFGGVFQTCSRTGYLNKNLCSEFGQKNPLTGDYSCPEEYEAVLLDSNSISDTERRTSCHSFLIFFESCDDYYVMGSALIKSYWCAAKGPVPQHWGFQFGGLYTDTIPNLLTESKSCPIYFYPLKIGNDIHICVSDDFELGFQSSVPFAGFYSCISGNPLAIEGKKSNHSHDSNMSELIHSLGSYLQSAHPSQWPKRCPSGYSSHTASIEHGCEINYCVKANAFSDRRLPPLRRPPFVKLPPNAYVDVGLVYRFEINKLDNTWTELPKNKTKPRDIVKDGGQRNEISLTGVVIAISVCGASGIIVIIAIILHRRKKKNNNEMIRFNEETNPLLRSSSA